MGNIYITGRAGSRIIGNICFWGEKPGPLQHAPILSIVHQDSDLLRRLACLQERMYRNICNCIADEAKLDTMLQLLCNLQSIISEVIAIHIPFQPNKSQKHTCVTRQHFKPASQQSTEESQTQHKMQVILCSFIRLRFASDDSLYLTAKRYV